MYSCTVFSFLTAAESGSQVCPASRPATIVNPLHHSCECVMGSAQNARQIKAWFKTSIPTRPNCHPWVHPQWSFFNGWTSSFIFSSNGPTRHFIFGIIPPAIKMLFPRLTGIIDCFETFIEAPSNLKAHTQAPSWSNQFPFKSLGDELVTSSMSSPITPWLVCKYYAILFTA